MLWVKLLSVMQALHMGVGLCPNCFTSDPAFCQWPGKVVEYGPGDLAPAIYVADLEEAPGP